MSTSNRLLTDIDFAAQIVERQERERDEKITWLAATGRFYLCFMHERVTIPEFDRLLAAIPEDFTGELDYYDGPGAVGIMLDQCVRALSIIKETGADPLPVLRETVITPLQVLHDDEYEHLIRSLLPLLGEAEDTESGQKMA